MSKKNKLQSLINQRIKQLSEDKSQEALKPKAIESINVPKKTEKVIKIIEKENIITTQTSSEKSYLKTDLIRIGIYVVIIIILIVFIYIFRNSDFLKNISQAVLGAFNRS
jgi:hypothetical protein